MVCRLLFVAFREPIFEENLNKYAKRLACNNLEIQYSILYGILCVYSRHFLVHNVDSKNLKNPFYCVVSLESAGGGGFGPPKDRDNEKIRYDLKNGYISLEKAKEIYGFYSDD